MSVLSCVIVLLTAVPASAGWEEDLDALLSTDDEGERAELLTRVLDEGPDWTEVASRIEGLSFPEAYVPGVPVLRTTVCIDTVERPWVLAVPETYDPETPTPLLLVLHGGVSSADVEEDPIGHVEENELAWLAEKQGWIALFPFGQAGATWWDEVGMANIRDLIRTAKRELNVDDDRIWMAGFSDGASAGFAHAMIGPDDYAAFVALNGHMGVGSLDGDLAIYAPNLANTPIYATTTFDDGLYPSAKMRGTIEMAQAAGGDILYREMKGGHDFDDVEDELPGIARFLDRHPRDPFPTTIVWETAGKDFGRCRWFAIDEVTRVEPAPWHEDHNAALVNDRITVGFQPDWEYEGEGVLIDLVVEGDYPAQNMGLLAGDVIVRGDDMDVPDMDALNAWKGTIERGDEFTLTVTREGETVTLFGRMPPPENYNIFKREKPSAAARVSYSANRIDVDASRVGAFRVMVHPDMIRLDEDLVIAVRGEVVYDAPVEPDLEYLIQNFLDNRDRRLLYVAEIAVDLP
jgi:pimeloyl-ACP methyl ester carboxylesterase